MLVLVSLPDVALLTLLLLDVVPVALALLVPDDGSKPKGGGGGPLAVLVLLVLLLLLQLLQLMSLLSQLLFLPLLTLL